VKKSINEMVNNSNKTNKTYLKDSTLSVSLDNVSIKYGNLLAVKNVFCDIKRNQVTSFIGPSGCGKSTVLRAINRMNDLIDGCKLSGSVIFEGIDIYAEEIDPVEVRRRIGMVFQQPNPFPKSIYENIAFGARVNGYKGNMDQLVEESLIKAAVWEECKDKLNESGYSLSGGQQQRLCIARTIAIEPDVILMDEPCSALDPLSTLKIEETIHELKKKFTIIIVTHNMQQANRVSDYTAFFNTEKKGKDLNGKVGFLVEFGKTKNMFNSPKQKSTQDYISGKFG
tara:strand:+ start:1130 stop:1978 length:849 start_codon:yes stop_codon:yes gene_type:complete